MCGIAGYSGHLEKSSFNCVVNTLGHRGPDDSGVFVDEAKSVGLGHTRLSILDLSDLGHQPMFSDDRNVVIVFNGEIYNYKELRVELETVGCFFAGNSDTEVLLQMYLIYGVEMLNKLNGIFAFAIWDEQRDHLFLARDAMGVKPLYFLANEYLFVFASELKAIYSCTSDDFLLDNTALDLYLTYLWCPGDRTPDSRIRKLCPGEAILVSRAHVIKRWTWYELPHTAPVVLLGNQIECISGTLANLRTAVHRQMVSDVPVGAFLSGGLDSSSIVSLAREINPEIQCFTIDVTGSSNDGFSHDLPYARQVATHLGVPLEILQVDSSLLAASLEEMVWQLDEPLADPAPLNVFCISQFARQQGIKVLLSGAGGDDLFTGYRRHLAYQNEQLWGWLPRSLRIQLRVLTSLLPVSHPFFRRLRKAFSGAHLDGDARLVNYFRWIERSDLYKLYTPSFRSALDRVHVEDPMLTFLSCLHDDTSHLERMLALEQRFFLTDHNLSYTDKMSMAAGLEVRVPFLDLDLVNFASRIPSRYKQCGKQSKWVLKKAMEPYLPREVIYRPKSGFGAPLRSWLTDELSDWLADILSADRLKRRGLFEPMAVQRLISSNREGTIDASYTLFSLACIEIWCRHFIDNNGQKTSSVF